MKRAVLILSVLTLLGYGAFEARRLAAGPELTIDYPKDGAALGETTVTISGTAQNIAFLTVNDAPAYTDSSGHFTVTLAPPRGYSVFTVAASDRFGRRASRSVAVTTLAYCPA